MSKQMDDLARRIERTMEEDYKGHGYLIDHMGIKHYLDLPWQIEEKKKQCTHQHAIRGKCLTCGKEGV